MVGCSDLSWPYWNGCPSVVSLLYECACENKPTASCYFSITFDPRDCVLIDRTLGVESCGLEVVKHCSRTSVSPDWIDWIGLDHVVVAELV